MPNDDKLTQQDVAQFDALYGRGNIQSPLPTTTHEASAELRRSADAASGMSSLYVQWRARHVDPKAIETLTSVIAAQNERTRQLEQVVIGLNKTVDVIARPTTIASSEHADAARLGMTDLQYAQRVNANNAAMGQPARYRIAANGHVTPLGEDEASRSEINGGHGAEGPGVLSAGVAFNQAFYDGVVGLGKGFAKGFLTPIAMVVSTLANESGISDANIVVRQHIEKVAKGIAAKGIPVVSNIADAVAKSARSQITAFQQFQMVDPRLSSSDPATAFMDATSPNSQLTSNPVPYDIHTPAGIQQIGLDALQLVMPALHGAHFAADIDATGDGLAQADRNIDSSGQLDRSDTQNTNGSGAVRYRVGAGKSIPDVQKWRRRPKPIVAEREGGTAFGGPDSHALEDQKRDKAEYSGGNDGDDQPQSVGSYNSNPAQPVVAQDRSILYNDDGSIKQANIAQADRLSDKTTTLGPTGFQISFKLPGGINHSVTRENAGTNMAWQVASKAMATKMINAARKNGGLFYIVMLSDSALLGNEGYWRAYEAATESALKSGKLSPLVLSDAIKASARLNRIRLPETSSGTYTLRDVRSQLTSMSKRTKFMKNLGGSLGDSGEELAAISKSGMVTNKELVAVTAAFQDAQYGDIVGAFQLDLDDPGPYAAEEIGGPHPAYPFVLRGKSIRFKKPISLWRALPEYQGIQTNAELSKIIFSKTRSFSPVALGDESINDALGDNVEEATTNDTGGDGRPDGGYGDTGKEIRRAAPGGRTATLAVTEGQSGPDSRPLDAGKLRGISIQTPRGFARTHSGSPSAISANGSTAKAEASQNPQTTQTELVNGEQSKQNSQNARPSAGTDAPVTGNKTTDGGSSTDNDGPQSLSEILAAPDPYDFRNFYAGYDFSLYPPYVRLAAAAYLCNVRNRAAALAAQRPAQPAGGRPSAAAQSEHTALRTAP